MPSFDPKCYELAVHFLPDDATEERKCDLASDIQAYVEMMALEAALREAEALMPAAGIAGIPSL